MCSSPLGRGLFQAAPEPETVSFGLGFLLRSQQAIVIFGVWLVFSDDCVARPDDLFIEHLCTTIGVGQQSPVAVLALRVEFQIEGLSVAEAEGIGFCLGAIILLPFRCVNADEPYLLGAAPVFDKHGIAVDEGKETGWFHGLGMGWQGKEENEKSIR